MGLLIFKLFSFSEYGEFDFIVIGSGTTGSIVASRLAEVKKFSVLLLEAGAYPDKDLTRIPALFKEDGQTKFNWGFTTVPQENFCYGEFLFSAIILFAVKYFILVMADTESVA